MSAAQTGDAPDRAGVLASYDEAVRAIGGISVATGTASSTEPSLVGPSPNLHRGSELAAMNTDDLARLPETEGAERMEQFAGLADGHLRRLSEVDRDLVLGSWSGLGELSVGRHTGGAIGEWHVHAWDLTRTLSRDHLPHDRWTVARGQRVGVRPAVFISRRPGWTTMTTCYGAPQQIHLDLHVVDYSAAHEEVVALGARLLQPASDLDADEGYQVYADQAGHPFCIGWGHPSSETLASFVAEHP